MKHTKKCIGIALAAILLSCQYSPATASYIGAVPIPTESSLSLTHCEVKADFAHSVMQVRQVGVSKQEVIALAPEDIGEKEMKGLLRIIDEVYTYPILSDKFMKLKLAEDYSSIVYLGCVGSSKR